ncbi:hypothetical protein B7463_g4847, partial [Scytalidium lignicola]
PTSTNPATGAAGAGDVTDAPARPGLNTSNRRHPAHEAKVKVKKDPGSPRAAATASSSGTSTRFQCPRCPKNFSRIENLTRHQANHDEVGKFGCPVCKKRFTRSDLLNRHRRIHGNAEAPYPAQSQPNEPPVQSQNPLQDYGSIPPEITPQQLKPQSNVNYTEQMPLPQTPARFHGLLGQNPYQPILPQQDGLGISDQLNLMDNPTQTQGLSNLADAALTPGMSNVQYDGLQAQQANTTNPALWNGFMLGDTALSNYGGSYDADISWTLQGFNPESSPGNMLDYENIMNPRHDFVENTYQTQPPQLEQPAQINVADPEDQTDQTDQTELDEAESKDWPDKPADNVGTSWTASRILPLRLLSSSWHPAVQEEARLNCRSPAMLGSRRSAPLGNTPAESEWLSWIEMEKRKRVGLSVYIYDSQYPALFNNQGYIAKAETTNCSFPCADEFWEARTADDWKMLVGPNADEPPTVFYLHGLNCCLLRKWVKPPPQCPQLSEFGKVFLMYALHAHIFEWRQSTIMYNPTGLKGVLSNMSYAIGKSLLERRRWLLDTLDTWSECYQTPQTTPAAVILLQLAYISLDVSLSDLHLMAGRSSSPHDQLFSQENLTQWANSDGANSTMTHVYTLLSICHQCIASGIAAQNSFEITVGLFTGGLVCWAYGQFRNNAPREEYLGQVNKASRALSDMNSWMMCTNFGKILSEGFKVAKNTG